METQLAHINTDEGFEPRIEGTRIKVKQVAEYAIHLGWSAVQISEAFRLSLAQVHAALAYYHDHTEEIEAALAAQREKLDSLPSLDDLMSRAIDLVTTPQEIAAEYPITPDAVYKAIERHRLPARQSAGTWLILREDAEKLWGHKRKSTSQKPAR